MDSEKYLRTDDYKIINIDKITWARKINECFEICTKTTGCSLEKNFYDTHKLCKLNNINSYNKLNDLFINIENY